jgi:hypothetical protein
MEPHINRIPLPQHGARADDPPFPRYDCVTAPQDHGRIQRRNAVTKPREAGSTQFDGVVAGNTKRPDELVKALGELTVEVDGPVDAVAP